MAKPDATVYVRLEQMQWYMSGWSGCNGICPAGADATVYVRLERMQWYMSGFCLHVSGPDIYRCFCSNRATVTGF